MILRFKKAQSTLEYALLITVVVGVLIGMQAYLKRGLQGKFKDLGDQMGNQYSPGLTRGTYQLTSRSTTLERYSRGFDTTLRVKVSDGLQTTKTDQQVKPLHKESWPATYTWGRGGD